jgi:hypothetical protein
MPEYTDIFEHAVEELNRSLERGSVDSEMFPEEGYLRLLEALDGRFAALFFMPQTQKPRRIGR